MPNDVNNNPDAATMYVVYKRSEVEKRSDADTARYYVRRRLNYLAPCISLFNSLCLTNISFPINNSLMLASQTRKLIF
jgi:hypothetical protein